MSKAYWINAEARQITVVELPERGPDEAAMAYSHRNGDVIRSHLNDGYMELAFMMPTGDVMYVDENGLDRSQHYFRLQGVENQLLPYAGNGLVVGAEMANEEEEFVGHRDVGMPLKWFTDRIIWVDRTQFDAIAKANASDPFISYRTIDSKTGEMGPEQILQRIAERHRTMPKPTDDEVERMRDASGDGHPTDDEVERMRDTDKEGDGNE
jgi:hypothetical protein